MEKTIAAHYGSDNLKQKIISALEDAGKDPDHLALKDLSVIDQLHTGGHRATLALAEKAGLGKKTRIFDAGCGIGGSSRLLAQAVNGPVTGMDLVDEFIDAAQFLTQSTGFESRINFITGDICGTGLEDSSFDCVWCQHTLMNIKDKKSAFDEFRRILAPNGTLVLHEVVKGDNGPIHLPVPWADDPAISFLDDWETIKNLIIQAGFTPLFHRDLTDQAREWWQKVKGAGQKATETPRPLGPHIIFGKNGPLFGTTMDANLQENRIKVMEAVFL
ncbi:MAG: class I SAM-dependent methyltransferase [Desulfobacteraceae bacterium]